MLQSPTYREDIIAAWIQRQDQVLQQSGAPTWQTLVKALKNPQVGQGGIANDISRHKNIHTASSTESGTCIHFLYRIKIAQSTEMGVYSLCQQCQAGGWLTLLIGYLTLYG